MQVIAAQQAEATIHHRAASEARSHRVVTVNPAGRQVLEHNEHIHRELLRDEEMEALLCLSERIQRRFGVTYLIGAAESVSRQSGLRSTISVRPPISDPNRSYTVPTMGKYYTDLNCCRMQQKRLHKSHERSVPEESASFENVLNSAKDSILADLLKDENAEVASSDTRMVVIGKVPRMYSPRVLPDVSSSDSLDDMSHVSSDDDESHRHEAPEDTKTVLRLPQLPNAMSPPHSRRPISCRTSLKRLGGCTMAASSTTNTPNTCRVTPTPPTKAKPAANLPSVRSLIQELEKEQIVAAHVMAASKDFQTLSAVTKQAVVEREIRHKRLVEEKFSRIEGAKQRTEEEEEARLRAHYKQVRLDELEAAKLQAEARETAVIGRRREQDSFMAALAFIAGDERRDRQAIEKEFAGDASLKWKWLERVIAEGLVAQEAALYTGEAQREEEEIARAKLDAERAVEAKRRAEFAREQLYLKKSCTHSRSGTSVFVGSTARNVCLICKVKYDPKKKLYVRLR